MRPPTVADWLLARVAPPHLRRDVLGDLHEEYRRFSLRELNPLRARLWYWRQVMGTIADYHRARGRPRGSVPGGPRRRQRNPRRGRFFADVRYAARTLAKAPGFTAVAVATLAMGIGPTTAIFSAVNGVLLSPLPFDRPKELVVVGGTIPGLGSQDLTASAPEYRDFLESATSLSGLAATWNIDVNLTNGERPERLEAVLTSTNLFSMLRATPALGRDLQPEDAQGDIGYVAIISHEAWQRFFDGDPGAIGRALRLDDDPITVVGVMPEGFIHPGQSTARPVDVWVPIDVSPGTRFDNRQSRPFTLIGRLKPGTSLAESRAEFATISATLMQDYPQFFPPNSRWDVTVVPLLERVVGDVQATLFVLFGSVGFVLLIACTNVANLILTRGSARSRELAIRAALGGSRGTIMRQLLTESLTLAVLGGTAGLALAWFVTERLQDLVAADFPRVQAISIDASVLAFTLVATLLASVAFGLMPALQLSRANAQQLLRESGQGASTVHNRVRDGFVVLQISISLVLLIGSGLMVKSFARLLAVDPGFESERVLALQTWLPWPNDPRSGRFFQPDRRIELFDQALARMDALAEVTEAGLTSVLPLRGLRGAPFVTDAVTLDAEDAPPTAEYRIVSPNYFEVLGIPVLRGRAFTAADDTDHPLVVVVNQALADRYFGGEDPVGKRLRIGGPNARPREVVGVVGNVRHQAVDVMPREAMYATYRQRVGLGMTFVLKTRGEPIAVAGRATAALQQVDADLPVFAVATLDDVVAETVAQRSVLMTLLGLFALQALALAAIGVYGVIAHAVKLRSREIGIRMALGANRPMVLGMILREGGRLGLIGVTLGLFMAVFGTRLLASMLFDVGPLDPVVFLTGAVLSLMVAGVATLGPARRATRLDPVVTLKTE